MPSNQITPLLRPSSKEATDLEVGAVVNSASIMVDEISDEKAQTCYDWTTGDPILLNRLSGLLKEAHNIWELSEGRVEEAASLRRRNSDVYLRSFSLGATPRSVELKPLKRPADPPLDLHLLRNEELNFLCLQGKREAEEALLGSGFLGGYQGIVVWLGAGLWELYLSISNVIQLAEGKTIYWKEFGKNASVVR